MAISTKSQLMHLYTAFDYFNKHIFNNNLPKTVLVLESKGKCPKYGHFTPWKSWKAETGESVEDKCEIAISTEHLNRPNIAILGTLLHEMVHLHNYINDIQDVSRQGRYHNKRFLDAALKFGMIVNDEMEKHKIAGYLVNPDPSNLAIKDMVKLFDSAKFNSTYRIETNPSTETEQDEGEEEEKSLSELTIKYEVLCEHCQLQRKFTSPKGFAIPQVICMTCGTVLDTVIRD